MAEVLSEMVLPIINQFLIVLNWRSDEYLGIFLNILL